jgi:hypothetical protein
MTNFYQVIDHIDDQATYVHQTEKAARAEAKERRFHAGSDVVMTRIIGHWDMVTTIQGLLNNPKRSAPFLTQGILEALKLDSWELDGQMNECTYPKTTIFETGQAQKVIGKF